MTSVRHKTICITAGGGRPICRYFLRSGLLSLLTAKEDVRIVLLVIEAEVEGYRKEFGSDKVTIVGMSYVPSSKLYELLLGVSRNAFNGRLNRIEHRREPYHERFRTSFIKMYLKRFVAYVFGTLPPIAWIVQATSRFMGHFVKTPIFLQEFFDKFRPDLVFTTSITYNFFDVPVMLEARRRGIPVAGSTRGSDQLSGQQFMVIHPDCLLAQSEFVKKTALFHFFPKEKIRVIGFPHYDWFTKKNLIMPREEFLVTLGIDPDKRFILLGAAGELYHKREVEFAKLFSRLMKEGKLPKDLVLLFRTHPYNEISTKEDLDNVQGVIPDRVRARGLPKPGFPDLDRKDIIHQMNSLYHCEMVLTIGGTIVFDAAVFDKPVVVLGYDGPVSVPHWLSLKRLHDGTSFDWEEIDKCKGYAIAASDEELIRAVNNYLDDSKLHQQGRQCIMRDFVNPFDGKATERLAGELLSLLK